MGSTAKLRGNHGKPLERVKNSLVIKKLDIIENIIRELIKYLSKPIEVGDNIVLCRSDFVVASTSSGSNGKSEAVFKVVESDKTWLPSNARLNYLCDAVELAHSYLKTGKVEKTAIVFNGSHYTILFALKD